LGASHSADEVSVAAADSYISVVGADYTLTFQVTNELDGATDADANGDINDTITIKFPAGTVVSAPTATVSASPGWVGGVWANSITAGITWEANATNRTLKATLNGTDQIGEGATILIKITAGVKNPGTPGTYSLTVATSQETTAVTSSTFEIKAWAPGAVAGVVSAYNAAGYLVYQAFGSDDGVVEDALLAAGANGRVELAAGTYAFNDPIDTVMDDQTLKAVGTVGAVIITPDGCDAINIGNDGITIDGFKITGADGSDTANPWDRDTRYSGVYVNGADAIIKNCSITTGEYGFGVFTGYDWADEAEIADVTHCTIDATADGAWGVYGYYGVNMIGGTVAVGAVTDKENSGVYVDDPSTIDSVVFTGDNIGCGVGVEWGPTTIKTCTFNKLEVAVYVAYNEESLTITGNTIRNCSSVADTPFAAIEVADTNGYPVYINGNLFSDNQAALNVADGYAEDVFATFNKFSGNTGFPDTAAAAMIGAVVYNADATEPYTLDVRNNWWGAATGPADGTVVNAVTTPFLTEVINTSQMAADIDPEGTLDAKAAVGVKVTEITDKGTGFIAVGKYASNPVIPIAGVDPGSVAPAGTVLAYLDVFIAGADAASEYVIKFYVPVTANTVVYAWDSTAETWLQCASAVDRFNGCVSITVNATTSPGLDAFGALPVAIVNPPAADIITPPAGLAPLNASVNVPINTGFSWTAVKGATYSFEIADNAAFNSSIKADVTDSVYGLAAPLKNATTYYWRVKVVNAAGSSSWTNGVFTTAAAPTTPAPQPTPTIIVPTQPVPTVTVSIPAPVVTVEQPAQGTQGWIYAIVAIGAVLIIVVIVLIIRTRRAP